MKADVGWTKRVKRASGDWSIFKQLLADHWEAFQRAHPRYQTSNYASLVAKKLTYGNPEHMGYIALPAM